MNKYLFLVIFLAPSFCSFAATDAPCSGTTLNADLKGDGGSERIEVVNEKVGNQGGDCHFKSLMIFENDKKVYEEIVNNEDEPLSPRRDISVERFLKGSKEMLVYAYHTCSNCNGLVVIGYLNGKYQSIPFSGETGGGVIDLESDGNKEIVLDPHGYYGLPPKIYDYDPEKDSFVKSDNRHPKFFEKLIAECEENLVKFPEKGTDCCNRTANLQVIASAAKILGDDALFEKTNERLCDVQVDIGKAYYFKKDYPQAISAYKEAVKSNPRNYVAFNFLGYSYLRDHKNKDAIDSLKNSITLDPAYVEGHYNLALAYWADNEESDAIKEIKTILKLDPKYKNKIKDDTQFNTFKNSEEFQALIGMGN